MTNLDQELTIVFSARSVRALEAWGMILAELTRVHSRESTYEVNGNVMAAHDADKMIPPGLGHHFNVQGRFHDFDLSIVGTYAHDAIRIRGSAQTDWDGWLHALKGAGLLIQAYVVDVEYDYWQNASDPLQYKAKGIPYEHLPMTSNGLPPPLERTVIDISGNPGRQVLRQGFIEAIGFPMWLSERFFRLSGATLEEAFLTSSDFAVRQENDLVRIETHSGKTAACCPKALKILRNLLFPRAEQ